jgi:hypothetical protein
MSYGVEASVFSGSAHSLEWHFKLHVLCLPPYMSLFNLTIGWVALIHMSEVLGSNSGRRWTVMTWFSRFSEVPPGKCRDST